MTNEEKNKIANAVDETTRLYFENPTWTLEEIIDKAKELVK